MDAKYAKEKEKDKEKDKEKEKKNTHPPPPKLTAGTTVSTSPSQRIRYADFRQYLFSTYCHHCDPNQSKLYAVYCKHDNVFNIRAINSINFTY